MSNSLAVAAGASLSAAAPYYGVQPAADDVPKIKARMLIHYAQNDDGINKGMAAYEEALKKAGKVTVPFAVPQGANGDAYHMYPLFSGLGGYIFGTTASGSLNVKDVGLDNPTFRKNQGLIDQWNKTGLINSKVDYGIAKTAFTTGKSPFWITGPWELDAIKALVTKSANDVAIAIAEHIERARSLLKLVGLEDFEAMYPHQLSGGMQQRVGLARALAVDPAILLFDEPFSALDPLIRREMQTEVKRLHREVGKTMVFITHDLEEAISMSDRVVVMYLGKVMEQGPVDEIFHAPKHPYTRALLGAVPGQGAKAPPLAGDVPSPLAPPNGCRFHTRCPTATPAGMSLEFGIASYKIKLAFLTGMRLQ